MTDPNCIFCKIISGQIKSQVVYQDGETIAFLDNDPLFPGHVLLSPTEHYETLPDVPPTLAATLMLKTQLLAQAVVAATESEGSFIAINNRVSQTVPHLHIHVVPRRRKDGLKGFFWPRQGYKDPDSAESVRDAIEREMRKLMTPQPA